MIFMECRLLTSIAHFATRAGEQIWELRLDKAGAHGYGCACGMGGGRSFGRRGLHISFWATVSHATEWHRERFSIFRRSPGPLPKGAASPTLTIGRQAAMRIAICLRHCTAGFRKGSKPLICGRPISC
jgi:hypothetical protein